MGEKIFDIITRGFKRMPNHLIPYISRENSSFSSLYSLNLEKYKKGTRKKLEFNLIINILKSGNVRCEIFRMRNSKILQCGRNISKNSV